MYLGLLLLYFAAPLVIAHARRYIKLVDHIGVVTVCYGVGLFAGNLPGLSVPEALAVQVLEVVVPLSIPLLLFGSDLRVWRTAGAAMIKSFGCGVMAVSIAVAGATLAFGGTLDNVEDLGGMMMGVYTGGTPNMSAIGITLGVDHEVFVVLNAADVILGGAWLLFLLSVGKPLIDRILRSPVESVYASDFELDEAIHLRGSSLGLLLSVAILGTGIGLSFLLFGKPHAMTILLVITSLGIAGSGVERVRALEGSFGMGNYLLLVFCVAVGSLANVQNVVDTGPSLLAFVGIIMGGTIVLHLVFARVLKIDADTMIISSAAGIFGPAFIAPIARAMGNPQIIPLGLALSLLGLAIGNYCGLAMAYLLSLA